MADDERAISGKEFGKAEREHSDEIVLGPGHYDHKHDVFGEEQNHDIKYKTLSWQAVAVLMITEIVSNGTLSLPSSLAAVGLVPGVILIAFLGAFALFTSWLLARFKLRHPEVHSMGDAGYIIGGPILRDVLAFGTVVFAVFLAGSQFLSGQITLASLSDNKLCLMLYTGIFAIPILLCSLPRTLDKLGWMSYFAAFAILMASLVGMIGAGVNNPISKFDVTVKSSFTDAFDSITNPVFAYAGHFMFFIFISEMKHPEHAMRAAWTLQIFATTIYILFASIVYVYIGPKVASPAFTSLPPKWQKAAYAIAIPNFLISGALSTHTAAKLIFVRIFRKTKHLHSHTVPGWSVWIGLVVLMNGAAFVLAIGVPIFNYLVGLASALFASWYTYGLAGAFYLYDTWIDGGRLRGWVRGLGLTVASFLTLIAGAFICVAGLYVIIKGIKEAYDTNSVGHPFSCSAAS